MDTSRYRLGRRLPAAFHLGTRARTTDCKEPDIKPAQKDLWEFRWEHAQARIAARRGNPASARFRRLRRVSHLLVKLGWTWTVRLWWKSHQKKMAFPIESALLGGENQGWRAAYPGTQTIRLIFDEPQELRRIWLVFEDYENPRTQEFVLRWSADGGKSFRETVRQQWNFSSPDSAREIEDYTVELSDVTILELIIVPDKSGGAARASLASFRLA
jgi:hypothetical protein